MEMRNIAIIAHVDHGKTTLIDQLLKQSGLFRENEATEDRMMDSMDQEKERGITIAAKNASFEYKGIRVNIIDTPGHSDFGGEVERILNMVDGAILLVDASEGPLPQTRFVLQKALAQDIKVIACINKIDRPDRRIEEVEGEIFDLFVDVSHRDDQVEYDTLYAVGRDGWAVADPSETGKDLSILINWIVEKLPPPKIKEGDDFQMLVTNIDYNDFVGRLAIGRVLRGKIKVGDDLVIIGKEGQKKIKVRALYQYRGMAQVAAEEISAGDVAVVAGMDEADIGDTLAAASNPEALPRIDVEEPTVGMFFSVNDGPFCGKEGKHVTSRKIGERLEKELKHNVSLRVEPTDSAETWKVLGRGELQLGVFIENLRREGFELLVSKPEVIFKKDERGEKLEPFEKAVIDVPQDYVGAVTEKLGTRKGILQNMTALTGGRTRVEFKIPSRGLIGYRNEFLTDTRGTGLLNTEYIGYEPFTGEIPFRKTGSLVADRPGKATTYALFGLEARGKLFIKPQTEVYSGMVIGENAKENELMVNVIKEKKLTNVRASGSDDAMKLTPIKPMSLEYAMEWISDWELIEVTPENIRIRCKELDPHKRKRK